MKKVKPVSKPVRVIPKEPIAYVKISDRWGNSKYGSGDDLLKIIQEGG